LKNNFAARFAEAHKKTAITVFIIAILASVAFSVIVMQLLVGPRARWNQTYGGPNADQAFYAVQTSDGGYAIAGWTESFGAGSADFWLIKTDSNSNMQWNQTYGGAGTEYGWSVIQTSDGGYAIAGSTESFGAGSYDFWLIKTCFEGESDLA
jgi:hypothetical protein